MSLLLRLFISLILLFLLSITFSQDHSLLTKQNEQLIREYQLAEKFYRDAEKMEDEASQDGLNQKALDGFKKILPLIGQTNNDSLGFYCYFKIGVLEHYFGNLAEAGKAYNYSLYLKDKVPALKDSVSFKPLLYSGIIYYSQSQFDSALTRYKQAEAIAEKYTHKLSESERLFNTLGALYFETGNYRQSRNYFEKAANSISPHHPYYNSLLVNYKINLAQVLVKLEEFDAANSIYQEVLSYNTNKNEIYHNIGIINLTLGAAGKALEYFRKVTYSDAKIIKLLNDIGFAFYNLEQFDSAGFYLQKADAENRGRNGSRKNVAHGLTMKYMGDVFFAQKKYEPSLQHYQQAILQFNTDFADTSIHANPAGYGAIFSYINLFNTLTAKATALEEYYEKERNTRLLSSALNSYESAFKLVDYVERSYESDEARLFLNKIKYMVHSAPIDLSLRLFELTKEKTWLEQAYKFDQRNKASVLSLSLQENEMREQAGVSAQLVKEISGTKAEITRLSLKAARLGDSSQLKAINDAIRDKEIELARLQEKLNQDPKYSQLQPAERIPAVSAIQTQWLDKHTALVSYHLSETELLILHITKEEFNYVRKPVDHLFFAAIDSFVKSLHDLSPGEKYSGQAVSRRLYQFLVKPVLEKLKNINRLIIIPDDELNYIPFEALQDERSSYLVEDFAIQYRYSTALLNVKKSRKDKKSRGVFAFAPFANGSIDSFSQLKYSNREIEDLKGKILFDKDATKDNFVRSANQYATIHLATHATANDDEPARSFIAFYPSKTGGVENSKLYAGEIYDLDLDSTDLVILSACETGSGQLIRGEGLMSLSRAFAYAGCPNIITSLWKAEDKTTAFVTQRLHHYLAEGLSKDRALQKAKIDLLNSGEIGPHLKTPNYWAHLLFIGNYEPERSSTLWWWVAAAIVISAIFFLQKKSRRKGGT
jgi:CHAT domain-containing protein